MALQEMEGQVNQLRRICESITDDKETLEKRIEEMTEEKEKEGALRQNLKS